MKQPETLIDLRNHLYRRGEFWWLGSLITSFVILVIAIIQLWTLDKHILSIVMVCAVIAPIAVSWMREIASTFILKGDKCRRLILFADSLGQEIPASQIAEINGWALGSTIGQAPFVQPYYASTFPPGPKRLADNIAESAFFTKLLAAKAHTYMLLFSVIAVLAAITVLLLSDMVEGEIFATISKSIAIFVAFLASGDIALTAKKYGDLAGEAQRAFDSGARLRVNAAATLEEARTVAEEYGIALLQAPPLPSWLYTRYLSEINRMYRDSHS